LGRGKKYILIVGPGGIIGPRQKEVIDNLQVSDSRLADTPPGITFYFWPVEPGRKARAQNLFCCNLIEETT